MITCEEIYDLHTTGALKSALYEAYRELPPVGGGADQLANMAHEGVVTAGDMLHRDSFPGVFMHRRDDLTPYSKGFLR